jgi:hypothetical protein
LPHLLKYHSACRDNFIAACGRILISSFSICQAVPLFLQHS